MQFRGAHRESCRETYRGSLDWVIRQVSMMPYIPATLPLEKVGIFPLRPPQWTLRLLQWIQRLVVAHNRLAAHLTTRTSDPKS